MQALTLDNVLRPALEEKSINLLFPVLQAELILRLAEMCRRLESEEEKVIPFYVSSLNWDEQKAVSKVIMEKPVEPLAQVSNLNMEIGEVQNCGLFT